MLRTNRPSSTSRSRHSKDHRKTSTNQRTQIPTLMKRKSLTPPRKAPDRNASSTRWCTTTKIRHGFGFSSTCTPPKQEIRSHRWTQGHLPTASEPYFLSLLPANWTCYRSLPTPAWARRRYANTSRPQTQRCVWQNSARPRSLCVLHCRRPKGYSIAQLLCGRAGRLG